MKLTILAVILLLFTGCAAIFSAHEVECEFETAPPGQQFHVNGRPYVSPTKLKLSARETHEVRWPDGTVEEFGRDFNGLFVLDIILLSPLAIIVDVATGAITWNISPSSFHWPKEPVADAPQP